MKKLLKSLLAVMLIAMMAFSFTSCGVAKNPEKAEKKLKDAGYEVEVVDEELGLAMYVEAYDLEKGDIECVIDAQKDSDGVTIYYCANAKAAKKIYDALKKDFDEMKEEIKKLSGTEKELAEEYLDKIKYGKSGKVVYVGTKNGVKAA